MKKTKKNRIFCTFSLFINFHNLTFSIIIHFFHHSKLIFFTSNSSTFSFAYNLLTQNSHPLKTIYDENDFLIDNLLTQNSQPLKIPTTQNLNYLTIKFAPLFRLFFEVCILNFTIDARLCFSQSIIFPKIKFCVTYDKSVKLFENARQVSQSSFWQPPNCCHQGSQMGHPK